MVTATEQYARNILHIRESDRFFSVAKLFFAYGLGTPSIFPWPLGQPQFFGRDLPRLEISMM